MKKTARVVGNLKRLIPMLAAGLLAAMVHAQSATPAPTGLVDWWRAEVDATDSVGTNNGTISGGVTYTNGEVGHAFLFDGSSGYVSISDSPFLDVFSHSMTIECWMKSANLGDNADWEALVAKGNSSWRLMATTFTNTVDFSATGLSPQDLIGKRNVNDGQWHHVAGVYDGTNMYLYVDGTLDVMQAVTGTIAQNNEPLAIGNDTEGSYFFGGSLDEVSLYSRALSASEIAAIYNAGSGGKIVAPQPPWIFEQPANKSVIEGKTGSFSVIAAGSPAFSYQWFHGGNRISGATNSTFTVTNAQVMDGGEYYVVVSNPAGSTNSSTVTLTVVTGPTPTNCTPTPAGLIAWWRAEGDATDSVGTNDGTINGGVTFPEGEVGQAFLFDGNTGYVSVPASSSLDVGAGEGMTIECWIWPHNNEGIPIVEWDNDSYSYGASLWVFGQSLYADLEDIYLMNHEVYSAQGTISYNHWQHVAVTYDRSSGNAYLYINGVQVTNVNFGNIQPETGVPVYLGDWPEGGDPGGGTMYSGLMDEVSIYNRALSPSEVQAIYNTGSAGKCFGPVPPSIESEPTNETVAEGGNASFSVIANGLPPLTCQWFNSGGSISGATNWMLNLSTVQLGDADGYYVVVSNAYGWTNSSVATLTVTNAPAPLPPVCTPTPGGLMAWWRADGDATDTIGANNGTINGGVTYTNGEVGQAFAFDGTSGFISVPPSSNLDVGTGDGLTIECWIWPSQPGPIVAWETGAWPGTMLLVKDQGILYADLQDINGNDNVIQSPPGAINSNGWQHVALTYDRSSGNSYLYINGVQTPFYSNGVVQATNPNFGKIRPATYAPLSIGYQETPPYGGSLYGGLLDEFSLYNRALGPSEIQAIYNAGSAGKCYGPVPPSIAVVPTNESVADGASVCFSVAAAGYPALSYQWFNGSNSISGATDPVLNLDTVHFSDAGSYYAVVSNIWGWTSSPPATLTVTNQPPTPECTPAPGGIIGWWRAEGDATDFIGTNNGILLGGLSFTNGEVGQGFWFNNTNQGVDIPSCSIPGLGNSCTLECWINPSDVSQSHVIFDWNGLEVSIESGGVLALRLQGYEYGSATPFTNTFFAGPGLVVTNAFQHIAVTYILQYHEANGAINGVVYLYYNGVQVASMVGFETYRAVGPSGDLYLGDSPTEGIDFAGILDEVSLYVTTIPFDPYIIAGTPALSGDQIAAICNAGPGGKCSAPAEIVSQPTNEVVPNGGEGVFSVTVDNPGDYSYQWQLDGTNLPSVPIISTVEFTSPANPTSCVAVDKSGNVFFSASGMYVVQELATNGVITTVAGNGQSGYSGDGGAATNASMGTISGIAVDGLGNLFIADSDDNVVRKVDASGIITTFAGNGTNGYSGDGVVATNAEFSGLSGVAEDAAGNLYIADSGNNVIRKVDTGGIVRTFAGNGIDGFAGDGGAAVDAELLGPSGVAVDNMGNVFIADSGNLRIRKVDTDGVISTFAGGGTNCGTDGLGDGGPATGAQFGNPVAVAVDGFGNLFIADLNDHRIREVFASDGLIITVAGTGQNGRNGPVSCACNDGGPATAGELSYPGGVAAESAGTLYIADDGDLRIREVSGLPPYPSTFAVFDASGAVAGNYSVVITTLNTHVSVTSSVASLSLISPPTVSSMAMNADGSFSLNLVTMTNMPSRIYAATGLCPPIVWQPIYTNSTGGTWQFTDTNTGGILSKFYWMSTP